MADEKNLGEEAPKAGGQPTEAIKAAAEKAKLTWGTAAGGKVFRGSESKKMYDTAKTAFDTAAEGTKTEAGAALKKAEEGLHKEFGKLGFVQKNYAKIAANIGQASTGMKIVRGGAALGGLIVIGSGVKNLVAPEHDENGERKGSAWKQVGKIGAGAAALYASVIYGGANKAMGI